jgi:hypothetical protein
MRVVGRTLPCLPTLFVKNINNNNNKMIYRLETSQAGSNETEVYINLRENPKVTELVLPQVHA